MAEWYIRVYDGLTAAREVEAIAARLGKTPQHVAGRLLEVWFYFATESDEGQLEITDSGDAARAWFDSKFHEPGLCSAMEAQEWISVSSSTGTLQCTPKGIRYRKKLRAQERAKKAMSRSVSPTMSRGTKGGKGAGPTSTSKVLSTKYSSKSKKKEERVEIPAALADAGFRAVWAEWEQRRRAKRWGWYPPSTEKRWLNGLALLGSEGAIECVRHSLDNGYQGLFPEKVKRKAQGAKDALADWLDAE